MVNRKRNSYDDTKKHRTEKHNRETKKSKEDNDSIELNDEIELSKMITKEKKKSNEQVSCSSNNKVKSIVNEINKNSMKKLRLNNNYRESEKEIDSTSHTIKQNPDLSKLLIEYFESIKEGPTSICCSCGGLYYNKSIRKELSNEDIINMSGSNKICYITDIEHTTDKHKLCRTCWENIKDNKVPKLSLSNGLDFVKLPTELKGLTELEERLICPRIPFMQLRKGRFQQSKLFGNIVNVAVEVDTTVNSLPRRFDQSGVIQVELKRKMAYRNNYMCETIRPFKVFEAANYLVNTDLYKSAGVYVSEDWGKTYLDSVEKEFIVDSAERNNINMHIDKDISESSESSDSDSDSDENECHCNNIVNQATLVQKQELYTLKIAPGEGKRPQSLLMDHDAPALSFPTIFGGQKSLVKKEAKLTPVDIEKSRLRNRDRRAANNQNYLLYAYKIIQNLRLQQTVQICLRKKKGGKNSATAKDLLDNNYVTNLVNHDDGYRMLKGLKGSSAYWESKQKACISMNRQLGMATFFLTLSAAETKWTELLVNLSKINKGTDISEEQAESLSFEEMSDLINGDPITCARHFDHKFRCLLKTLIKHNNGVFGKYKVRDHFIRVEFQHRGSPHVHCLFWLDSVPKYNENDSNSIEECIKFIDEFITCQRVYDDPDMEKLIQFQNHKHSFTCKQKVKGSRKKTCRFNFPYPPMPHTQILNPIVEKTKKMERDYESIKNRLEEMGRNYLIDEPFDQFIRELDLSEDEYYNAIRSNMKRTKVFLKRSTNAIFINPYNEILLRAWKANMDIQFVLDPYACAKYIVNYISKGARGVSKLLREANNDIKRGNISLREKLRKYANIFSCYSEISAQEAAYGILCIPLTICSRGCIFINTSLPDERVFVVKSEKELKDIEQDSTDIAVDGIIEHYIARPDELENLCLADFAAWFTFTKKGTKVFESIHDDITPPEQVNLNETQKSYNLKSDKGKIKKRNVPLIIRFRRYSKYIDYANFCRENIMLFAHWRNEDCEVISLSEAKYLNLKPTIDIKAKEYGVDNYDKFENAIHEVDYSELEENPEFVHNEFDFELEDIRTDFFEEMGIKKASKFEFIMSPKLVTDEEFEKNIRSMNSKQRKFIMNMIHLINKGEIFYHFLTGGAGVGKSHVIKCIIQYLLRSYGKRPGFNPELPPVIAGAPTGKAAFNIGGMTLHCIFRLPPNQISGNIADLDPDSLNSLRCKYSKLKLLIIDEISMVSVKQLFQIDQRLRQIMHCSKPFGGISILVVGDFWQISPVAAKFVFENPSHLPLSELIGNPLWNLFEMFELTEIMRQRDDLRFARALNNMAIGKMTDDDVALFESRQIDKDNLSEDRKKILQTKSLECHNIIPPIDAIWLFTKNNDCKAFNEKFHKSFIGEEILSEALDSVEGKTHKTTDYDIKNLLRYASTFSLQQSDGMPYSVNLKIGAEYMITTNIDVSDGLFNGATGTLKKIQYANIRFGIDQNKRIPIRVFLDFSKSSEFIGSKQRLANKSLLNDIGVDACWTPIGLIKKTLNKTMGNSNLKIVRQQIPLIEANGITFHKSQSSSIPHLVVTIVGNIKREILYVGCSRGTTLNGLYIKGDFKPPNEPNSNNKVLLEIARLKEKGFIFKQIFLQDLDQDIYVKIIFQNLHTFIKHKKDIVSDDCFLSADIMAFVEPWLKVNDIVEIDGFKCISRVNCEIIRNSYGSVTFHKLDSLRVSENHFNCSNCRSFQITSMCIDNVKLFMVYKSPKSSCEAFYEYLENTLISNIIGESLYFGDFNIEINDKRNHKLIEMFSKYGFILINRLKHSSTDSGSQIDLCFSNMKSVKAWYYDTIFCYHKPVCITWRKDRSELEMSSLRNEIDMIENNFMDVDLPNNDISGIIDWFNHEIENDNSNKDSTNIITLNGEKWLKFDVEGDGNCFFSAISHQLVGNIDMHLDYRQKVVDYMKDKREEFESYPFDNYDGDFERHLKVMAMSKTWVDQWEITAFCKAYSVKIVIHHDDGHMLFFGENGKEYNLLYSNMHYASLTKIH